MIEREIIQRAKELHSQFPILTITGPRQSGKTTLCRNIFPNLEYINLESYQHKNFALNDPIGFLKRYSNGAIFDEIQNMPDLLNEIMVFTDEQSKEGMFVLIGSQQFHLMKGVSQSLAGRTGLLNLLPLTLNESGLVDQSLEQILYQGFYPRIIDKKINPTEFYDSYFRTYIERDVRELLNIKDLHLFEKFLSLCAARTGQILNVSHIARDCGISHNTAANWLSILEASFIIYLLKPHYKNFNKRLIKSPKLYFLDVGLVSYLLNISDAVHLINHPLKGNLFETLVISEIVKFSYNYKKLSMYYYRDSDQNEIDILIDLGSEIIPLEIKLGQTVTEEYLKKLKFYLKINPEEVDRLILVYTGDEEYSSLKTEVINFKHIHQVLSKIT
jgi:uncharacterized protein